VSSPTRSRAGTRHCRGLRSAAALWAIGETPEQVKIITTAGGSRRRDVLIIHRTKTLPRHRRPRLRGIPVTSSTRTLIDLAAVLTPSDLADALNEACALGLTTERALRHVLHTHAGRPGTPALRRLLEDTPGDSYTRSKAETALLALIDQAGLPRPLTNRPLLGIRADVLLPAQKLIVEFDGYPSHGHNSPFERDRARDRRLTAGGYRVISSHLARAALRAMRVLVDLVRALGATAP
jgi:very-short-patch-repair endonuclease